MATDRHHASHPASAVSVFWFTVTKIGATRHTDRQSNILLYGTEACVLNKSALLSLDFVTNRLFTSDNEGQRVCPRSFVCLCVCLSVC